jgi:ATP-binding cassette subfamily F protein 3
VDNVRRVRGDFTVEAARQYLARFRFWGDDPLRVVSGFSGGERSRLALAKLLLEPKNLLFLDEPTNHLDIPASEILEEALIGFEGTVILVSHDRRFLENVTTRIVHVREGHAEVYPGGFKDYERASRKETKGKDVTAGGVAPGDVASRARADRASPAPTGPRSKSGDGPRQKYEEKRQIAGTIEKKKRRVRELEAAIAAGEKDLDALRGKIKDGSGQDWEKLAKMAHDEQALTKKVDAMLLEWARLSEEVQ